VNVLVVVEGEVSEPVVYGAWIPLLRPGLRLVGDVFSLTSDTFAIVSGGGYPFYFGVIDAAIEDAHAAGNVDRVVIAIDSEEMTLAEKRAEVADHLAARQLYGLDVRIVVQHFCIETWGLGNRRIHPRHPKTERLKTYRTMHNVRVDDPEMLPANPPMNRAQFAEQYLRAICNDRQKNLTYSKRNPQVMVHSSFLAELRSRLRDTGHIASFQDFLDAFGSVTLASAHSTPSSPHSGTPPPPAPTPAATGTSPPPTSGSTSPAGPSDPPLPQVQRSEPPTSTGR
jgi:hypothetical protein